MQPHPLPASAHDHIFGNVNPSVHGGNPSFILIQGLMAKDVWAGKRPFMFVMSPAALQAAAQIRLCFVGSATVQAHMAAHFS